jgi:hypothetical protein
MNEIRRNVNIYWKLKDLSGNIIMEGSTHNTIVDDGLAQLDKLSNGVDTDFFDDIAIGTDATAVQTTDSALVAEFDRQQATATYTADKAQWVYEFTFGSGVSETIEEIGVFNGASVMLNRALTGGIPVNSTNPIEITVTLNGTRA